MKKSTYLIIMLLLSSLSIFAQEEPTFTKPEMFDLKSIVTIVNRSIIEASKKLKESETKLKIKEAEITLQTIYDLSGGGEFKVIAKASKKWELEKTTTLTFSYSSVEEIILKGKSKIPVSFEKKLTDAIISAANQWKESTGTVKGLSKEKFNVEVSFMAKKLTGGGVEFEIWGVGADLSVDNENSAVHTVSLTFK